LVGVLIPYNCAAANTIERGAKKNLCEDIIPYFANLHDVPVDVLFAIGLTESGRNGRLHPYALNVGGRSIFPQNLAVALREIRNAQALGVRFIDVGCMQINIHYHRHKFSSLTAMLNPEQNVGYAAKFLRKLYDRHGNWTLAAARYHAGPNNETAQRRYVCALIRNLIYSGRGRSTARSRSYCNKKADR